MDTILQIDIKTKEIIAEFLEISDAVKKYPQHKSLNRGIKNCLDGAYKSSFGFIWIYRGKHKSKKEIVDTILQIDINNRVVIDEFDAIDEVIRKCEIFINPSKDGKFIELSKKNLSRCLKGEAKTFKGFGWIYKSKLKEIGLEKYILQTRIRRPNNLFINLYPELVKEWNHEKNTHCDINSVSYGSAIKIYWNCLKDKNHSTYFATLNSRTSLQRGCPSCAIDNTRVHDKKEKEGQIIKNNSNVKTNNIKIGDDTEIYVYDLLRKSGLDVERIGQTGDRSDLVIVLPSGDKKSLQVKTLVSRLHRPDSYIAKIHDKYDKDMLVVMVNKDRNRFSLEFVKNIEKLSLSLSFINKNSKYNLYTDEKVFLEKLIELIPFSSDFKIDLSDSGLKEFNSLKRLEIWCFNKGFLFRRNGTNGTVVDCYIGDIPIQHKYRSLSKRNNTCFTVSIVKSAGSLNGKHITQSYSINDEFECIVVEIGGTEEEPEKYHGNFCFIPKSLLIERRILNSETCKKTLSICPPDYSKSHWSKDLWH